MSIRNRMVTQSRITERTLWLYCFILFWFLNEGYDDVGKLCITQDEGYSPMQANTPSSSDIIIPEFWALPFLSKAETWSCSSAAEKLSGSDCHSKSNLNHVSFSCLTTTTSQPLDPPLVLCKPGVLTKLLSSFSVSLSPKQQGLRKDVMYRWPLLAPGPLPVEIPITVLSLDLEMI